MSKSKYYREIKDSVSCPCGSGGTYKKCCKKKDYRWKTDVNGNIAREIPLSPEVYLELKKMKKIFIDMFGRDPGDERIFCNIPDDKVGYDQNVIRLMRNTGVDEAFIYAYYKTGLIVTSENKKLISDIDYASWLTAIEEYNQIINHEMASNMDVIQAVAFANSMLRELCSKYFEQLHFVFGMFISLTQDQRQDYNSFKISSILDYLAYCAHKTQKNIVSIQTLLENGMVENAFATVRFIFESYLTAAVYVKDKDLFYEKVLPLAGLDQGTYSRVLRNDGTLNRYLVKDNQINKIFDTRTVIKDLAIKSSKNDEAFYTSLYGDLSQYVHVDVLAAKKYFSTSDPFYEVDEALLAGYLSIFFSMQLISILCNFEGIPTTLQKDLRVFTTKVRKDITVILELLICIDELPFYETIKTCLSEKI